MSAAEGGGPGVGTPAAGEVRALLLLAPVLAAGCRPAVDPDYTGLDDPQWRAVELLASAWEPAMANSYRLGYKDGYTAGGWDAEQEMARGWATAAQRVRQTLRIPSQEELRDRRRDRRGDIARDGTPPGLGQGTPPAVVAPAQVTG